MKPYGRYIMIEGGEGSGKGTQAKLLQGYLAKEGYEVVLTREPGGTSEAEKIRERLLNQSLGKNSLTLRQKLDLFIEARMYNYQGVVIPSLNAGKVVIKDRGWPSTLAYQGYAEGIDLNLIEKMNLEATGNIRPDLLFIIDVPAKNGLEKEREKNNYSLQGIDYHTKVNQGYLNVARNNQDISIIIPYQEGEIEEMHEKIIKFTRGRLRL